MSVIFAIVGRNKETGALLIARLTRQGQKLYNQFNFDLREQGLWLDWIGCEDFDTLMKAVREVLEPEAEE